MTPAQSGLVQESFAKLQRVQDTTAQLFYLRLLERDPSLQNLFSRGLNTQCSAILAALGGAVGGLDDLDSLRPALRDLGRRHVCYGVKAAHYASFGEALLWTLEVVLGDDFDREVRQAWIAFYQLLSSTMVEAATQHVARARKSQALDRIRTRELRQRIAFAAPTTPFGR